LTIIRTEFDTYFITDEQAYELHHLLTRYHAGQEIIEQNIVDLLHQAYAFYLYSKSAYLLNTNKIRDRTILLQIIDNIKNKISLKKPTYLKLRELYQKIVENKKYIKFDKISNDVGAMNDMIRRLEIYLQNPTVIGDLLDKIKNIILFLETRIGFLQNENLRNEFTEILNPTGSRLQHNQNMNDRINMVKTLIVIIKAVQKSLRDAEEKI